MNGTYLGAVKKAVNSTTITMSTISR